MALSLDLLRRPGDWVQNPVAIVALVGSLRFSRLVLLEELAVFPPWMVPGSLMGSRRGNRSIRRCVSNGFATGKIGCRCETSSAKITRWLVEGVASTV